MYQTQSLAFHEDLGLDEVEDIIAADGFLSKSPHSIVGSPSWGSLKRTPSPLGGMATDLMPSQYLRERLISLFFQHVFPLCPVIDENYFKQLYSSAPDLETFFQYFSSALFKAMLFTAVQVSDLDQTCSCLN